MTSIASFAPGLETLADTVAPMPGSFGTLFHAGIRC